MIIDIDPAKFPEDKKVVQELFREYQQLLGIDLGFQDFEHELASLPGRYVQPAGNIALARLDKQVAGCICWYPMSEEVVEIKRLYVRPAFRGRNVGRMLMQYTIESVTKAGYEKARLDSLGRLKEAANLYESFDFKRISPYNENPLPDVYYMELDLAARKQPA
ncbi:MAG: GNAT family N-acetyltransferase [Alphaproteobacteria bacterium]